jgi:hypothetical protein
MVDAEDRVAEQEIEADWEARVREVMDELGVSRDAARLYLTVEAGHALVGDRISLSADRSRDDYLELTYTLESVAGSLPPLDDRPQDFDEQVSSAKEERAERTMRSLRGPSNLPRR